MSEFGPTFLYHTTEPDGKIFYDKDEHDKALRHGWKEAPWLVKEAEGDIIPNFITEMENPKDPVEAPKKKPGRKPGVKSGNYKNRKRPSVGGGKRTGAVRTKRDTGGG